LLNSQVNGLESRVGSDRFTPVAPSKARKTEPATVKPKLTRNCIDKRLSFPNMSDSTIADSTNIQAKPQIKPATAELEVIHEATSGTLLIALATVSNADWVKIW